MILIKVEILMGDVNIDFTKADIFAFGRTLFHIFTGTKKYKNSTNNEGKYPFDDMISFNIVSFVASGKQLEIPPEVPKHIQDLIAQCCEFDAKNRPLIEDVVKRLDNLIQQEKYFEIQTASKQF